ncbi:LysR family transcriptional regulator (plasmid) [Sinorhizobium americanum CCGM7]|uniref:LysR family transcriptional regulator n=1 Tax=Sinorhizobium americanum TaxID=194963 RepID=UPI0004D3F6E5|nr:LysR family transcriptional regulator [Sinorhizobium americanum]APG89263.1 LysR family transcriptional regulator [Sinorhizobium americanum CCGM7]
MDYNAVSMFVAVAQVGSLSAAATRMGIPLPTLSRKIAELESYLKVQLLERTARGCRVTEAGSRLFEHASGGIEALQEAERSIMNEQARLIGRLRLSLPQSFEPWWVLLGLFQHAHPDIQISVYSTERRVDLLADGVDVALRVGTIADDTVVARHMLTFRHILVASPKLVERHGALSHPADLSRYPCAAWGSTLDARPVWMLGGHSHKASATFTVNDYLHLRARAIAGDIVTELPSFLAAEPLKKGALVELLPKHPFPNTPLHLVYRRQRHASTIVRAYLDFCSAHLSIIEDKCRVPFDA